jgi:hypothetical protein
MNNFGTTYNPDSEMDIIEHLKMCLYEDGNYKSNVEFNLKIPEM